MSRRFLAGCIVVLAQVLAASAQTVPAEAGSTEAVAKYGSEVITAAQLDTQQDLQYELVAIRNQEYDIKRRYLEQMIFDRLVDKAAAAAGLSREAYLKAEVSDKAGAPPDADVDRLMRAYRSRLDPDEAKARQQVVSALTEQREDAQRAELKKRLFREAKVEILLEPIRFEPVVAGQPSRGGGEKAPVTLVEYSDFQCPYCGRIQPELNEIVARYGDKVRHVFKQLPLTSIHPNAQRAAEASLCAADQGEFWPMHNWLFANQGKLDRDSLVAEASALGMDVTAFKTCMDSNAHAADIRSDTEEARRFGINGTPGFIIQGRFLNGAQPLDRFVQIIDEELQRAGVEVPSPKQARADSPSAAAPQAKEQ